MNKQQEKEVWEYRTIDGNWTKKPVAYCKSKKGALTFKQMKVHRCKQRECIHLVRDVEF